MDSLFTNVKNMLNQIPIDFGGGCSVKKGQMMAWIIRQYYLQTTIDIGVYRGRSLFPQAYAHTNYTDGLVYGVDPWSKFNAKENDNIVLKDAIDTFVDNTDFENIYNDVLSFNLKTNFFKNCILLRKTSEDAFKFFNSENVMFDLVHVDGNHDIKFVMKDVINYTTILKDKAFIVMDDISWDSIRPALDFVEERYAMIFKESNETSDFAVYWKNNDINEVNILINKINSNFVQSYVI